MIDGEQVDRIHITSDFFTGWMFKAEYFELLGIEDQPAGFPADLVNRFYDRPYILSRELLPWESKKRGLSTTTGQFELMEDEIRFRSDIAGGDIVAYQGFVSDLASIPDAAAAIFQINTDDQRIAGGAWFHDFLYHNLGKVQIWDEPAFSWKTSALDRKHCDQILCFEAMADLGASSIQQNTAYQALRRFGHQWKGNSFFERLT